MSRVQSTRFFSTPSAQKLFEQVVMRSWWVHLVLALSFVLYFHARSEKRRVRLDLEERILQLEREKDAALLQKEMLASQIESQQDPAWIEMVLMKRLGLVPEGQYKVYFKQEGEPSSRDYTPSSSKAP